jgi:hypothetical protein
VHGSRRLVFSHQRRLKGLVGLGGKDLLDEGIEGGSIGARNEGREALAQQTGALEAEQARAGEVRLGNHAITLQREVGHGGEVVDVGVAGYRRFHLGPRVPQFLVLQLQFDLVDLQFVQEPLRFVR